MMYKWLLKSARERRPVVIIYQKQDGSFSKRTIMVNKINTSFVHAYCYSKKQYRTFKLERILAVEPYRRNRFPSA